MNHRIVLRKPQPFCSNNAVVHVGRRGPISLRRQWSYAEGATFNGLRQYIRMGRDHRGANPRNITCGPATEFDSVILNWVFVRADYAI